MNLWSRKKKEPESKAVEETGASLSSPYENVTFDEKGRLVLPGRGGEEAANDEPVEPPAEKWTKDDIREMWDAGTFYANMSAALTWAGETWQYESLKIHPDDMAFQAACNELYEMLMESTVFDRLGWLDIPSIKRLWFIGLGFGPIVIGVAQEMRQRRNPVYVEETSAPVAAEEEGANDE